MCLELVSISGSGQECVWSLLALVGVVKSVCGAAVTIELVPVGRIDVLSVVIVKWSCSNMGHVCGGRGSYWLLTSLVGLDVEGRLVWLALAMLLLSLSCSARASRLQCAAIFHSNWAAVCPHYWPAHPPVSAMWGIG